MIATAHYNVGNAAWPGVRHCVEEQCWRGAAPIHRLVLRPALQPQKKV
jgi:hypothetical protein